MCKWLDIHSLRTNLRFWYQEYSKLLNGKNCSFWLLLQFLGTLRKLVSLEEVEDGGGTLIVIIVDWCHAHWRAPSRHLLLLLWIQMGQISGLISIEALFLFTTVDLFELDGILRNADKIVEWHAGLVIAEFVRDALVGDALVGDALVQGCSLVQLQQRSAWVLLLWEEVTLFCKLPLCSSSLEKLLGPLFALLNFIVSGKSFLARWVIDSFFDNLRSDEVNNCWS